MTADVIFLFDVDNTLLDNDRFQKELREHLQLSYGDHACGRYWAIFGELWKELGYADYLGTLQRYRLEALDNPQILRMANWLLDYPFASLLYPGALETVRQARQLGLAAILSDGDAVFQPRKINRSGLWCAFDDNVLIYVHKRKELEAIERSYPANHYVLIDDKLAILDAAKKVWRERVTTVFPRQGHYASDTSILANYRAADITIERIADLMKYDLRALRRS
jgi:FMN phosphatase YigB (HAD superfamily)